MVFGKKIAYWQIWRKHNFGTAGAFARRTAYCNVWSSLPGLKRTVSPGGIDTSAPVRGLLTDTCLPGLDGEDAETAKFNAVTLFEGSLHLSKDSFHGHFGLGLGNSRLAHDFVDDIQLNQGVPQFGKYTVTQTN